MQSRLLVDFSQKKDDEGEPVPRQPIADAGFVAYEQGVEAVEPGVGVLDHDAAAVQLGVERGVVVGLPVRGAAVVGDIRFDFTPGAFLAKLFGVEGVVRVQEQPGDGNVGRFERGADFPKPLAIPFFTVTKMRVYQYRNCALRFRKGIS